MAASSYCSPSSSAVTIPIPGKSILKRPSQQQQTLFSRITKFLPSANQQQNNQSADDEAKPLKRAHFILPEIAIVYPISSINPPSTPSLKDEKRAIEDREYERRRRVVRGAPRSPGAEPEGWWGLDKVESFYRECCAGCDEEPDPQISAAFKVGINQFTRLLLNSPASSSSNRLHHTPAPVLSICRVYSLRWRLLPSFQTCS